MRPDGSSTISVLSGESMSAELAHELMSIQVNLKSWKWVYELLGSMKFLKMFYISSKLPLSWIYLYYGDIEHMLIKC